MDDRNGKILMIAFWLLLGGMLVLAGCKGDTGPAGLPGAPAQFGTTDCTSCHHLNNTSITGSSEVFVDGLAGQDRTVTAGTPTVLAPDLSKLPKGETGANFLWQQTGGLATNRTFTAVSASTPTISVTLLTQASGSFGYKQALVDNVPQAGVISTDTSVLRDATLVVPVSNDALELASAAQFKLTVFTASGKSYFDIVDVVDTDGEAFLKEVAAVNTGLNTVPVQVPVLLKAKTAGSYDWAVTGPSGAVTVGDGTTQIANFTPTVPGTYTVSVNGTVFSVFAGLWRGEITGTDSSNNPIPDQVCKNCHNDTIATDNFTPWRTSGHAHIFSKNLDSGGHYGPSCFPCHTVGFNLNAVNNGFDDQPNYAAFIADKSFFSTSSDNSRYRRMWSSPTYAALARETNVQCENCHGPQNEGLNPDVFIASHSTTTDPSIGSARTSMAADVCGSCHGEPLRHSRFQQWQQSGHGQFDLAAEEAISATTDTGSVLSTSCAGCHSAQGFLIYLSQLQSGIPLRTLPAFTIAPDSVQPITCQVCHDPHAEGTKSGVPNTATVRVSDNTPKLPGGFMATGVGRGAICIMCHNSRNGGIDKEKDSFLHEDGDPKFGFLTSYAAPHIANQGDVLMGHNAYFVGKGDLRSPHSLIPDTCANCHMEKTSPPPLLSYNLSGTNHTFIANIGICVTCHGTNEALGPMLQSKVQSELDLVQSAIVNVIASRTTGTPIDPSATTITTSHGSPAASIVYADGVTPPAVLNVASIPGLCINGTGCLNTDILAKCLWNYFLIQNDSSLGIHNPDFIFLVLGQTRAQAQSIQEP